MLTGYQGMGLLFSSRKAAISAAVTEFLTAGGRQSEEEGLSIGASSFEEQAREMLPGYVRGCGPESEVEAEQAEIDEEMVAEALRRKAEFDAAVEAA